MVGLKPRVLTIAVLMSAAASTAVASPAASESVATAASTKIAIPFRGGTATVVELEVQVPDGPSSGLPFSVSVADAKKLPKTAEVAGLAAFDDPGSGPGQPSTWNLYVAIDDETDHSQKRDALDLILSAAVGVHAGVDDVCIPARKVGDSGIWVSMVPGDAPKKVFKQVEKDDKACRP